MPRKPAKRPARPPRDQSPAKAAKPRWRRRKDDRPGEIVSAALDVFAARGFAAARLDDVAARAGVSKGTLYLYFPSKEALFKAVVRDMLLPNLSRAEKLLADDKAPTRMLLGAVLKGLVAVAGSRVGAIPKLVIAEAGNFPDLARFYVDEVVQRGMAMFARLIRRGVERGEFRAVDPIAATPILAAPIIAMALWKNVLEPHAKRTIDPEKFFDAYAAILFDGLALREKDPSP